MTKKQLKQLIRECLVEVSEEVKDKQPSQTETKPQFDPDLEYYESPVREHINGAIKFEVDFDEGICRGLYNEIKLAYESNNPFYIASSVFDRSASEKYFMILKKYVASIIVIASYFGYNFSRITGPGVELVFKYDESGEGNLMPKDELVIILNKIKSESTREMTSRR